MCVVTHKLFTPDKSNLFEAAHLIPIEHFDKWAEKSGKTTNEDRKVEAVGKLQEVGGVTSIFSTSLGITLVKSIHNSFDKYDWSINPTTGKVELREEFEHEQIHKGTKIQFMLGEESNDMITYFGKPDFPSLPALEYHYTQFKQKQSKLSKKTKKNKETKTTTTSASNNKRKKRESAEKKKKKKIESETDFVSEDNE